MVSRPCWQVSVRLRVVAESPGPARDGVMVRVNPTLFEKLRVERGHVFVAAAHRDCWIRAEVFRVFRAALEDHCCSCVGG